MASGSPPLHGAQIPSPRWWRPFRNVPLIIVAILSLVAASIGWITQFSLDRADGVPAAVAPTAGAVKPSADVVDACRAPVSGSGSEPWISDSVGAERVWSDNAAALSQPVVLGRDGWAFYNDQVEENFSQAIGRRYLSATDAAAWTDYFTAITEGLATRGIDVTIQITPSATSVYPQKLPEWTDSIVGSTPLDQLLVAAPQLPIIDFRAALRDASLGEAVFSPVNSHWTDFGGYVGWQTFAACNAALYPEATAVSVPPVDGVQIVGEFNEYASFGVPGLGADWTAPVFAEQFPAVQVTDNTGVTTEAEGDAPLDLSRLPAATANENAATTQTALILRDSMGNALSPYWQQQYAQTQQIQHRYDNWSNPPNYAELADEYAPDVVIIQLAERHLVNPPVGSGGF